MKFLIQLTSTNSLQTKAIQQNGRIYLLAKCKSYNNFLEVAKIPAEYVMYWYPLNFSLDYAYFVNYKAILLQVDKQAPKGLKEEFNYNQPNNPVFLKDFYNYREQKLGTDDRMYKLNLAITTKLKSMNLVTWDEFFNMNDVNTNFAKLRYSLDQTKNKISQRELAQNVDPDNIMNNPMTYATNDELIYLSDLGLGYKMTDVMKKIAKAKFSLGDNND